jgi:hypothetical protein
MTKKTGIGKYLMLGIIVAAVSIATVGSAVAIDKAYAGEYSNHASSGANSCGNDVLPTTIRCSNTDSAVLGDENAVALRSNQGPPIAMVPEMITDGFLKIKEAIIKPHDDGLSAILKTHGLIPQNGKAGPVGYGLITDQGLSAVIVGTSHKGVLDSEAQNGNPNNPVWHSHFVTLEVDSESACGAVPKVKAVTFQEPFDLKIDGKDAFFNDVPLTFPPGTTPPPNPKPLILSPGNNVEDAVSFRLKGIGDSICVTDLRSADNLVFK